MFRAKRRRLSLLFFTTILCAGFLSCRQSTDYEKLQGVWESELSDGRVLAVVVEGKRFSMIFVPEDFSKRTTEELVLNPNQEPKQLDLEGGTKGIYRIMDDRVEVVLSSEGNRSRPVGFEPRRTWIFRWKGKSSAFSPLDSNYPRGLFTWNYWMSTKEVVDKNPADSVIEESSTIEEAIKRCRENTNRIKFFREQFSEQLKEVSLVDPDVTAFIARVLTNLNTASSVLDELVILLRDGQSLSTVRGDDGSFEAALLNLIFDKPGAALDDETLELRSRVGSLKNKINSHKQDTNNILVEQIRLRGSLGEKYKRDFPQIKYLKVFGER